MERTKLQGVCLVRDGSPPNVCISKPGILELANIETELFDHYFEASDAQLHVSVSEVDLIVADQWDTNPSIRPFFSIEQRAEVVHSLYDGIGFHPRKLRDRLWCEAVVRSNLIIL